MKIFNHNLRNKKTNWDDFKDVFITYQAKYYSCGHCPVIRQCIREQKKKNIIPTFEFCEKLLKEWMDKEVTNES